MKRLRKLAVGLGIAGIVLATAIPATAAPNDEPFTAAVQLYHDGHYSAAYGHLV